MRIFFIFSIFLFILSSCTHQFYAPTYQPVPIVGEKHDIQGNIGIAGSSAISGPLGSISYTWPHEITSTILFTPLKTSGFSDSTSGVRARYTEFSSLYNFSIDKQFKLNVGLGYGTSFQKHHYVLDPLIQENVVVFGNSDMSFNKYFGQVALSVQHDRVTCSVSSRLSKLKFYKIHIEGDLLENDLQDIRELELGKSAWLFEPQFEFKAGWKRIKFQQVFSYSYFLSNPKFDIISSTGLTSIYININPKRKPARSH